MNWITGTTLLAIALTFAASMWNIIYTRRNLKTSKYIDTITSERIKWLSTVRNEVAELVSNIQFAIGKFNLDVLGRDENWITDQTEKIGSMEERESTDISVGVDENAKRWSATDYTTKLRLLQLRFNPNEDREIIESLEFFINFFSLTDIHRDNVHRADEHIKVIVNETQRMLKADWEKVKKEALGERKNS